MKEVLICFSKILWFVDITRAFLPTDCYDITYQLIDVKFGWFHQNMKKLIQNMFLKIKKFYWRFESFQENILLEWKVSFCLPFWASIQMEIYLYDVTQKLKFNLHLFSSFFSWSATEL